MECSDIGLPCSTIVGAESPDLILIPWKVCNSGGHCGVSIGAPGSGVIRLMIEHVDETER